MIERIVLPVKYPQVTSYTSVAHLLSILETDNFADNWIYSNFINLWCEVYSPEYLSQLRYENIVIESCPVIKYRYTKHAYLSKINVDLLNAIKAGACLGLYSLCTYDEYYLPYSMNFQKKHFKHQCMVYGYDENKQIFYIADFFHNNKYEFVTVNYEDMSKAIIEDAFIMIMYYRITQIPFDRNELINNVKDFLNSTMTKQYSVLQHQDKQLISENKMKFGLDCYDLIIEYIGDLEKYPVNMRTWLHALYDHKVLMINRIKYLTDNKYIKEDENIMNMFRELLNICEINRNLYIKYQIKKSQKVLDTIQNNLKLLKVKDEQYMSHFLNLIV